MEVLGRIEETLKRTTFDSSRSQMDKVLIILLSNFYFIWKDYGVKANIKVYNSW